MRRNLGILVGLIVFGMGSNSQADIVGLQSAPASPTSSVRFDNNAIIVNIILPQQVQPEVNGLVSILQA